MRLKSIFLKMFLSIQAFLTMLIEFKIIHYSDLDDCNKLFDAIITRWAEVC